MHTNYASIMKKDKFNKCSHCNTTFVQPKNIHKKERFKLKKTRHLNTSVNNVAILLLLM